MTQFYGAWLSRLQPTFGAEGARAIADVLRDLEKFHNTIQAPSTGARLRSREDKIAEIEVSPEDFGAAGNGTQDDTTAIRNAVTAAITSGAGAVLSFKAGKTYRVYGATQAGSIIDLQGVVGFSIYGNGATISCPELTGAFRDLINIEDSSDVFIDGLNVTTDKLDNNEDFTDGIDAFVVQDGSHEVWIQNVGVTQCRSGLTVRGQYSLGGDVSRNITMLNAEFNTVFYPQNFQASGDNYFARNIRAINCGRCYFPWNVKNHDVQVFSRHGFTASDVLLKCYGDADEPQRSKLERIKLDYSTDGRLNNNQTSGEALILIEYQLGSAIGGTDGAGQISDLDIYMSVQDLAATPTSQRAINMRKLTGAAGGDTTGRGHVAANWRISGRLNSAQNFNEDVASLFDTGGGAYNWTGDAAFNIVIQNWMSFGSDTDVAWALNGQAFQAEQPGLIFENIVTNQQITQANFTEGSDVRDFRNVYSDNLVIHETPISFTPSWTAASVNPSLGDGSVNAKFSRRGHRCTIRGQINMGSTTTYGTGAWRVELPSALQVHTADTGIMTACSAYDSSAGAYYPVHAQITQANPPRVEFFGQAGQVAATVPFTWASGDALIFTAEWMTNG